MNLLVIGNGFDLAHGLPTRYSDFLDFMVLCIDKYCPNWQNIGWQSEENHYKVEKYAINEILTYLKSNHNLPVEDALNSCDIELLKKGLMIDTSESFIHNQFLRYFICIYAYKKQLSDKFNWIDIEDEIENLLLNIFSIDNLKSSKEFSLSVDVPIIINDEYKFEPFYFIELSDKIRKQKNLPEEKLKTEIFYILFHNLEQFDYLLQFYLRLVQDNFLKNPKSIFNINTGSENAKKIDKILSFNYTNNSKIYINRKSNEKYYPVHFINGNLKAESKIILGIENPNKENTEQFCDNNINLFFKNVQRVLYDMFYKYTHWVDGRIKNLYIIGHSLAFSDKYILLDVIEQSERVTIYYYDEVDRQDKITNLYKLLGDEKFSRYVNNAKSRPYISLKNQDEIKLD